ncbi:hypothetical protein DBT46_003790, partial [Aerococcus mictus]|jgi:hypothetical protein|uniref:hypothetical protein n=1 Tax=Aerococcus mictus TaxID=2976810 RepID=UPI000DCC5536|nr:hypothetical protein DBT46_10080 [Aerococcus mictus]
MATEFKIEHDGQFYRFTFEVKAGIVTVIGALGRKSTQLGNTPPETIARMLAGEILREADRDGLL